MSHTSVRVTDLAMLLLYATRHTLGRRDVAPELVGTLLCEYAADLPRLALEALIAEIRARGTGWTPPRHTSEEVGPYGYPVHHRLWLDALATLERERATREQGSPAGKTAPQPPRLLVLDDGDGEPE